MPLTIGLIFMLLYTAFNSVAHAALIIANVPFAMIGGIVGLFITGQYLSVPSAIGFIAVFGVAMLNGIVLVAFMNELRARYGRSVREAVREAAALRLRPVLMTASVAILGLVPMLLSRGVGAETQRPLATVVVGGLFTSTVLTLVLLPLMYEWVEQRRERRQAARDRNRSAGGAGGMNALAKTMLLGLALAMAGGSAATAQTLREGVEAAWAINPEIASLAAKREAIAARRLTAQSWFAGAPASRSVM